MLGKEIPVSTPQRRLWHIVIVLAVCTVVAVPSGADDAASWMVDSEAFLRRNFTPAGPPASASAAAVEKLLAQMTLKEKIGQMTQLEIGMISDGQGQSMVCCTRARCRAAAAVVALVGDARRGYVSRDGDGCGHGSRLRRQRSFEPRQRCCLAETLCGLQLSQHRR